MKGRAGRSLWLVGVALLLALTGCAPALSKRAEATVAVLNGPAQHRIAGSAELLQREMQQQAPLHFSFVSPAAMRFAEGYNDLFFDRAATSAGRIARSYGARYAVLVGASLLERRVTLSRDKSERLVSVTLTMEAAIVEASTNRVVARFDSRRLWRSRYQPSAEPLPALQRDPTVLALRDEGVRSIAPAVVGSLWNVLGLPPGASAR